MSLPVFRPRFSWLALPLLVALLVLFWAPAVQAVTTPNQPIGQMARQAQQQLQGQGQGGSLFTPAGMSKIIGWLQLMVVITIVLVLVLLNMVGRLTNLKFFSRWNPNAINGRIFLGFLALAVVLLAYDFSLHGKYALLGDAASEHGKRVDGMLVTTLIITGIVFVVVQSLLFLFAYQFRHKEGRVAVHAHDNNRLEVAWTLVPAVVLAILVVFGVKNWQRIHEPAPAEAMSIEVIGEQFQWRVRYPGADQKLGNFDFHKIAGTNVLGLDFKDPQTHDDLIPAEKEIWLPVNHPVHLNIRAKDVLHGVYMPQFRVQMYAVPGMATAFTFTPNITTAQMRERRGEPEFDYEMACSQLCGASHFNMRMVIKVVSDAEFAAWLQKQKPFYTPELGAEQQKAVAMPAPTAPIQHS